MEQAGVGKDDIPPVIGWVKAGQLERRLLPWNALPAAFVLTWLVLLVVNVVRPAPG